MRNRRERRSSMNMAPRFLLSLRGFPERKPCRTWPSWRNSIGSSPCSRAAGCCRNPLAPSLLLEDGARLRFAAPLRLHASRYPIEALRAAILADDAAALGRIELVPRDYRYALWRTEQGVNVRTLGIASAQFLAAVYGGADAAAAWAAAAEGHEMGAVAQALTGEIMPAGFVRIEPPANAQGP